MTFYDDFIVATCELIAIDSVERAAVSNAPFGRGVNDALLYTLKLCDKLGFATANGDGYYGYADIGNGSELFGILGHLDTVPIGNHWTYPPLGAIVDDGIMYGRGILDDKAPMLACLFATAELVAEGLTPNRRIRIIFGCDEESGWECINAYVAREEIPTMAFTPDGDFPVIHAEKGIYYYDIALPLPSNIISISGGDRPNMVMDLVAIQFTAGVLPTILPDFDGTRTGDCLIFNGTSAHGSRPAKGDNAFVKMFTYLSANEHTNGDYYNSILRYFASNDASGLTICRTDAYTGQTTLNIGTCSTDALHTLHFSLDIRTPIDMSRDYVTATLSSLLSEFTVTAGFYHDPLFVQPDSLLVTSLAAAYAEVTGDYTSKPFGVGGGTYARALPCAVAFGPIFPGQEGSIHEHNEHCSLANLKKMYDVYKQAIKNICFS